MVRPHATSIARDIDRVTTRDIDRATSTARHRPRDIDRATSTARHRPRDIDRATSTVAADRLSGRRTGSPGIDNGRESCVEYS
jgi:hypothetical protein